jgi:myo-inositol catabolism protein IolC
MTVGYDKALYLLPFDHRHSYVKSLFNRDPPLSGPQVASVSDSKHLIYEGFIAAIEKGLPREAGGILVDEEFGADILRDARRHGFVTALSTERSGSEEFEFEYGIDFARHIDSFDPTFAKALVRYNVQGDADLNLRQAGRLKQLSEHCRRSQRRFMFELLVPATEAQLQRLDGDKDTYDRDLRPTLMQEAIRTLQNAGVEPDVWKVEGLAQRDDCERIVAAARCDGRDTVGCIVLGRGADAAQVRHWLATAAGVPGFIGFAVGRTTFWDAVVGWQAQTKTRAEAVEHIAARLLDWVETFETARLASTVDAAGAANILAGSKP